MQTDILETALDDLEGLFEAHRALGDDERSSPARRNPEALPELRREMAAAADSYLATLIASAGGDLSSKRITTCRRNAQREMKTAFGQRAEIASIVNQRRLPAPDVREDLRQLVTLSLHCRAAVAALAPTVDRRAADALANKVLVGLREATLRYLANAREVGDGTTSKPREAVVALLDKAEQHAAELSRLGPFSPSDREQSLGAALSQDVNALLHKTTQEWGTANPRS
jgi:hypothetical protein